MEIASAKRLAEIDLHRYLHRSAHTSVEAQTSVARPRPGQDKHHGPISSTKGAIERFFIRQAWLRAVTRMRVDPDPTEFWRRPANIHLLIEMIGDSLVVKRHRCAGAGLAHQPPVGQL